MFHVWVPWPSFSIPSAAFTARTIFFIPITSFHRLSAS
ncbi:MAG: hypothetical protein QOH06_4182 [Acidobacteriota bacterium]|jgi:hypothetical protein|nr:hypothetical protein [Acidobacteriota bacterium]